MKPEVLHALSVVILIFGLFVSAVGMVGTFFFGQEVDRSQDRQQLVVLQGLTDRVAVMQSDQAGLHERVASLNRKVSEAPPPPSAGSGVSTAVAAVPPVAHPPTSAEPETLPPIAAGPRQRDPVPPPAKPAVQIARPVPAPPPVKPVRQPPRPEPAISKPPSEPSRHVAEGKHPLTEMQSARLIKRLRAHPRHSIVIRAEAGDTHAVEMAMALRAAFRDAGWTVAAVQLDSKRAPFPGISLSTGTFPPPKEFIAAFGALESAGLRVSSDLDPKQSASSVVLSVGANR